MPLFPLNADDLFYRIEEWDDAGAKPVRTLAAACNHAIACQAFEGARRAYKHRRITMREGIKVNREYVPDELKAMDHRTVEQLIAKHEIPADWFDVSASRGESQWMVRVRSATGKHLTAGIVQLHQFVADLRKHGHDDYAKPFADAIEDARQKQGSGR